MRLFQLKNVDDEDIALFMTTNSVKDMSDAEVVDFIEAYMKTSKDEDNPLDVAEKKLRMYGIRRVHITDYATTDVL